MRFLSILGLRRHILWLLFSFSIYVANNMSIMSLKDSRETSGLYFPEQKCFLERTVCTCRFYNKVVMHFMLLGVPQAKQRVKVIVS